MSGISYPARLMQLHPCAPAPGWVGSSAQRVIDFHAHAFAEGRDFFWKTMF